MKSKDDPRITAYALSELEDDEHIEFEKDLAENAELGREIDAIRQVTELLEKALAAEPIPELSASEKRALAKGSSSPLLPSIKPKGRWSSKIITFYASAGAVAACLAITGALIILRQTGEPIQQNTSRLHELSSHEREAAELDAVSATVTTEDLLSTEVTAMANASDHGQAEIPELTAQANGSLAGEPGVVLPPELKQDPDAPASIPAQPGNLRVRTTMDGVSDSFVDMSVLEGEVVGKPMLSAMPSTAQYNHNGSGDLTVSSMTTLDSLARDEPLPPPVDKNRSAVVLAYAEESVSKAKSKRSDGSVSMMRTANDTIERKEIAPGIYPPPMPIPEPPFVPMPPWPRERTFTTESYDSIRENPFMGVDEQPLSTFSIDVDTASYANMRRLLNRDRKPARGSIRIEELINYFHYSYAAPETREVPIAVHVEVAEAPWKDEHRLVRVGLKGYEITRDERSAANLVFLIDVSGSMSSINKLPLVKKSLELLVRELNDRDRVAIVTYAGRSGTALPSTTANNKETILHVIRNLRAGGSTHASAGIEDAYRLAQRHFIKKGINRVILCTDGDFNVGITNRSELVAIIETKAKSNVFLSIFGFGMGNLKDATLEELTNRGNGQYGYVDAISEARKVFVDQLSGTLATIAKDVKIQVEFNPARVAAYRLIGYENRKLAARDFNDDTKDAGEIGAGHTVTALYEVVPQGVELDLSAVDPLKYQQPLARKRQNADSNEMLNAKLRYKLPDKDTSNLLEVPVTDGGADFESASEDFRFAAAVASFGMLLRNSEYKGSSSFAGVRAMAENAQGNNRGGYRSEFLTLVDQAAMIWEREERGPAPYPPHDVVLERHP